MRGNNLCGLNRPWGRVAELTGWKKSVYTRWANMVARCENPSHPRYKDYGGSGVKCEFDSIGEYLDALRKDPNFSNFCNDPEAWEVDKDIKSTLLGYNPSKYSRDTIMLVPQVVNVHDRLVRKGHPMSDPSVSSKSNSNSKYNLKRAKARGRRVFGIKGVEVHSWYGVNEASRYFDMSPGTISNACNKGFYRNGVWLSSSQTIVKGKLKGWTFMFDEDYTGPRDSVVEH